MQALVAYGLGFTVALVSAGTGRPLLGALGLGHLAPPGAIAGSLGLGALVYSFLFLVLGLAGWIDPTLYAALLGAGAIVALPGLRRLWRDAAAGRPNGPILEPRWLRVALLLGIAGAMGLALISSGAPVSDWDSREYHVGAAQRYIQEGEVAFHYDDLTLSFFNAQGMLNLWMMTLGSDTAGQVLTWCFAAGLLAVVYALGARLFSAGAGLVAAAIVASFPLIAERSIQPSSDMGAAMLSLLTVLLVVETRADRDIRAAVAVGIIAGGAVVFRMNSGLFLAAVAPFAVVWWLAIERVGVGRLLLRAAVGAAAFGVVLLPWLLRNYASTGNPAYPFLHQWFPSWAWNEMSTRHASPQLNMRISAELLLGRLGHQLTSVRFSALGVALAPLALLWRVGRPAALALLGLYVLSLAISVPVAREPRYMTAPMVLAAVLAGHTIRELTRRPGRFRAVLAALVLAILGLGWGAAAVWHRQFVEVALGITSRDRFLASSTAFYDDFLWMNGNLPEDARVLVISRDSYYLERPALRFVWISVGLAELASLTPHVGLFDFESYEDSGSLRDALREAGITHVFAPDPDRYWTPVGERGAHLFRELFRDHATRIRQNPESRIAGRLSKEVQVPTSLYALRDAP